MSSEELDNEERQELRSKVAEKAKLYVFNIDAKMHNSV
jgi:hypothetical protein